MADGGDAMTRQDVLDESAWEMVWFAAQTRGCEHLSTLGGDWVRAVERRRIALGVDAACSPNKAQAAKLGELLGELMDSFC
ncbi:hypothetical protein X797_003495 [Metarhizium robertsii]|uniref:Uncharacterized protein n=1 Tax=Metarhizium robertsii TaxID=568076 RepID=A0A0A1V240_9HYPO|nr:hypothetical protein X797_003495 [Metarhizium robertsii]